MELCVDDGGGTDGFVVAGGAVEPEDISGTSAGPGAVDSVVLSVFGTATDQEVLSV